MLDFIDVGIYRLQIREQLVSKSGLSRKRLVFTSYSRSNFSRAGTVDTGIVSAWKVESRDQF